MSGSEQESSGLTSTEAVRERYAAARYYLDNEDHFGPGEAEFDSWLAEHARVVSGAAWAEGWQRGFRDMQAAYRDEDGYMVATPTPNPYEVP